jgi:hypothetical protein
MSWGIMSDIHRPPGNCGLEGPRSLILSRNRVVHPSLTNTTSMPHALHRPGICCKVSTITTFSAPHSGHCSSSHCLDIFGIMKERTVEKGIDVVGRGGRK